MPSLSTHTATTARPAPAADLFAQAEHLFHRGMLADLQHRGLDIIEAGGQGAYIADIEGRRFLDAYTAAGTHNLGRRHPGMTAALAAAAEATDGGNFVLISEEKAVLASSLADFVPGDLEGVLFTVVRGEAVDAACKLARGYTGKTGLVTVDGGWYGHTGFALGLSQRPDKRRYGRLIPGCTQVDHGDLAAARAAIGPDTAAFIIEPVQVENGCRRAEGGYLAAVAALCRHHGALLIFDETQTGFGRTGQPFAKEAAGVEPDILVFGEAITAGLFPMTGLLFTRAVKSFFDQHPLIHLCTFGGHDVGCRVAIEALALYRQLRPWEDAGRRETQLSDGLNAQWAAYPHLIAGIAGAGLAQAISFQSASLAQAFCVQARSQGLLAVQGQVATASVVLRPPLTLSEEALGHLMELLSETLSALNDI